MGPNSNTRFLSVAGTVVYITEFTAKTAKCNGRGEGQLRLKEEENVTRWFRKSSHKMVLEVRWPPRPAGSVRWAGISTAPGLPLSPIDLGQPLRGTPGSFLIACSLH